MSREESLHEEGAAAQMAADQLQQSQGHRARHCTFCGANPEQVSIIGCLETESRGVSGGIVTHGE